MKLIRYGEINKEKTGVVINDVMYDTSLFGEDYNEKFFETDGLKKLQQFIESNKNKLQQIAGGTRIGSPVARPSKIVCIGLNYADHAKETGAVLPPEPVIFLKSTTALCGPYDNIIIPKNSKKTDWEVELAVVISKKASYVEEGNATDYVAGYCLHNDVSEREFQIERNGTWDKGKGCDTFAPLGPWLVTRDEFLISYVSQFMTLLPGDVISTGTPAGVGLGMNPQVYLRAGDVVELGIDGLGTARQKVVAFS